MYGIHDFVPPVAGKYRITSGEGRRVSKRTTNGARMSSFHHGTDWAGAKAGDKPDIQNITSGRVVFAGKAGGYGNTVVVENPDGYLVQYAHLDSINVKTGDKVPAGGKIGVMGATGNVTGTHLDLTVIKDGKTIRRDGKVLASAPDSIMRRAVLGAKHPQASEDTYTPTAQDTPPPAVNPDANIMGGLMQSQEPVSLLHGSVGIAVPETQTENALFSGIAGLGLNSSLEQIYAEAAKSIAGLKDSMDSKPVIQSDNPLRNELSALFDRIEV